MPDGGQISAALFLRGSGISLWKYVVPSITRESEGVACYFAAKREWDMNIYAVVIYSVLIADYVIGVVTEILNVRAASLTLPEEFVGYYDEALYARSQQYLKDRTRYGFVSRTFFRTLTILFIALGGFNYVDLWVRRAQLPQVPAGLLFAAVILFGLRLLHIPFSIYNTFVIEKKYGFNRTTPKTFVLDILKSWILTAFFGGIAFAAVIWLFQVTGRWGWLCCWLFAVAYTLFINFIYPVLIMPLFNKFTPLPEGELKTAIEEYARSQKFALAGIFTMDGSRRSTKSNAFFTGLGRFRRIALLDTLIQQHTTDELVSVLAHEIGHYKKRHIVKGILLSVLSMGLMFYLLSLFMNNPELFSAFRMENLSIYASLFFFGFLYQPISMIINIVELIVSRRYEYEADSFAVTTYAQPEAMITAIKKLCVHNLSNLTPHPLKVFLQYGHPPVLKRIEAIQRPVG